MIMTTHPIRAGTEVKVANEGIMIEEAEIVIGMIEIVVMTVTMKEIGSVPTVMIQEVVVDLVHGLENALGTMDVIMIVTGILNSTNLYILVTLVSVKVMPYISLVYVRWHLFSLAMIFGYGLCASCL